MTAPNIRNGVHIVAETDHYQLLNLDNDDFRLGFRHLGIRSSARRIAAQAFAPAAIARKLYIITRSLPSILLSGSNPVAASCVAEEIYIAIG